MIAARLRDLFVHQPDYTLTDLVLLTIGRHFRLRPDLKIILGRDKTENERIWVLAKREQALFEPNNFRGPTALVVGVTTPDDGRITGEIMAAYS